jgi:hypothetical protein
MHTNVVMLWRPADIMMTHVVMLVYCHVGVLLCWCIVVLVYCCVGVLSCWCIVVLVYCCVGVLSCWYIVVLVYCCVGVATEVMATATRVVDERWQLWQWQR